jgi:chlorobactene glucosyltransferase
MLIALLVVWVLSLVNTLLNLALIPRLRRRALGRAPTVSVLIPARDEERIIERTVRSLLAQTYPHFEVLVVDDRSTDTTGAILAGIAAEDQRLSVISGVEPPEGWLGKPWALWQASRQATGELLLFVDADIIYAPEALGAMVARMEESGVAMLSICPRFEMPGFWERVAMPQLALTVFTFIPTWLGNRTTIPDLGIGGGPGNLVRRDAYEAAGGHAALKDAVIDDVGLAHLLRAEGKRTELVRADDFVSLRMYHGAAEIIDGFTKNLFPAMGNRISTAVVALVLMLLVNLVPFALALTGNVRALEIVALIIVIRLALFASLGYGLVNAALCHPLTVAFWSWIFLRSIWKTGVRKEMLWRGRSYGSSWSRFRAGR